MRITGTAAVAAPFVSRGLAGEAEKNVRIGFIGVGGRGTSLLSSTVSIKNITIPAVCDINKSSAQEAVNIIKQAGLAAPELYADNETHWQKMLARDDLDLVIIATPWKWHTPMAVMAMKHGIVPGVEVPSSLSVKECWELVDISEKTGVGCMMLENWSFRNDNLALLNMARKGLFGQIVHVHCAHSHNCIDHWFFDKKTGSDRWPAEYLIKYNRDQYPTHSVGPVLSWCDINCGDRFTSIASTATGSFGINDYFVRKFGADHPGAKRKYAQGDIVTSTLKTANGKTVVVNYDMQLPRPYDNRWMLQGTRGVYSEERNALYLTGKSPAYDTWESFNPYQAEFQHKWWKEVGGAGGHGGVDGLELKLLIEAVRSKSPLPLDVYDSVVMSAIVELSGSSIAKGNVPVEFPDFTRGKWKTTRPKFALDMV
ncbi:MAG: Gfo/Idh/MocA family oxidoreductase [bacterium]